MSQEFRLRMAGRRTRNWNLDEEIRSRLPPIHFSAPLGIMGSLGSGRRTLAFRFAAMDANVLPRRRALAMLSSRHISMGRPDENIQPVTLHLIAYICPTPEGTCSDRYIYKQEWDRFCCLVHIFDITRIRTFDVARGFMRLHDDMPVKHILVGNKCDLRASVPQRNTVARRDIEEEANSRGITYYECSARMKVNVQSLLEDIQESAFIEKYDLKLQTRSDNLDLEV